MKNTFTDLHNQALTMGEYIEQIGGAYEALERERNALVAYSERLKVALDAMNGPLNYIPRLDITVTELLKEAPAQSLNHIKAQVEEETIERCLDVAENLQLSYTSYMAFEDMPRKYAKQAGSTAEDGE